MRTNKLTRRAAAEFSYPGAELKRHWAQLHMGDREPYPTVVSLRRLLRGHAAVAQSIERAGGLAAAVGALEEAWRAFHRGDFLAAMEGGARLGAIGVMAANKAAAIHTLYLEKSDHERIALLREAVARGETAVEQLPGYANAHYALALVLGRLSQRISIVEALAAGHGAKIRAELERTLELEPRHSEAHIALGLFHAELVKTLGAIAARLTYGASAPEALKHFRRAVQLTPKAAIARIEFAHGLALLDGEAHQEEIDALWAEALDHEPLDRTEQLDLEKLRERAAR